jgi:hypothetical protein
MSQAADWSMGRSVNTVALCPGLVRNSQPLRSSAILPGGGAAAEGCGMSRRNECDALAAAQMRSLFEALLTLP